MKQLIWLILALNLIALSSAAYEDGVKVGAAQLYNPQNSFMSNASDRVSMIVPALFVIICLVAVMIDFGAIGITLGAIASMIILSVLGIIALGITSIVAYIILGVILIFKMMQ